MSLATSTCRFAAVLLAVTAPPAFSAPGGVNWQPVEPSATPDVRFYIDRNSVRRQGKWYRLRLLYDFTQPQFNEELGTYSRSYIVEGVADCGGRRLAVQRMSMYPENYGKGILQGQTTAARELKWSDARPGTTNGHLVAAACERFRRK